MWTILAQQLSVLAVLALARWGGQTGTAAVYQYTQAVYVLPYAVLAVPVATVLYPRLTAAFEAAVHQRAASGTAGADSAVTSLVATSTALVTAVAVAGTAMLLAASDAAERFFSFKQVDGMGQALAVLAPGLIGYALIYQVTPGPLRRRPLPARRPRHCGGMADGRTGLRRMRAPYGAVGRGRQSHPRCTRSRHHRGDDGCGSRPADSPGPHHGSPGAAPVLTALAAGLPVALAAGLVVRVATIHVASLTLAVLTAVAGAAAAAGIVLAAIHLADRSLLRTVRGTQAPATSTGQDTEKEDKKDANGKEST